VRGEGGGEGYDEGVWRGFSEARKGEEASGGVQRAACSVQRAAQPSAWVGGARVSLSASEIVWGVYR
jgi:hypothetical protein